MWLIWILSSFFGLTYALCINDAYVIMSTTINLTFNIIIFSCRTRKFYFIKNRLKQYSEPQLQEISNFNPIHNIDSEL
jgi:hypothetical protein